MERSTHSRRSQRRSTHKKEEIEQKSFKETLLSQSIASGIIVAVVLGICVVKTDQTLQIKTRLKHMISTSMSGEELKSTGNAVVAQWDHIKNAVEGLFGEKKPTESTAPTENVQETEPAPEGDRVDEDILKTMSMKEEVPEAKKSPVLEQ